MTWHSKTFDTLTVQQLYSILRAAQQSICGRTKLPLPGYGRQGPAIHTPVAGRGDGPALAYCRLLPPGLSYAECSIGRVVTDPEIRKNGSGRVLMQQAIAYIEREWQEQVIRIGAQLYLKAFTNRWASGRPVRHTWKTAYPISRCNAGCPKSRQARLFYRTGLSDRKREGFQKRIWMSAKTA